MDGGPATSDRLAFKQRAPIPRLCPGVAVPLGTQARSRCESGAESAARALLTQRTTAHRTRARRATAPADTDSEVHTNVVFKRGQFMPRTDFSVSPRPNHAQCARGRGQISAAKQSGGACTVLGVVTPVRTRPLEAVGLR
ncbi:unnamed protein product [Lampetra planeri]